MKEKAFTLIELLAVLTIISLLSILIIPNITENVEKKKGEISDANMKILTNAADIYIQNDNVRYQNTFESSGSTYCISIQSLINKNILETPFKDIKGEEIDYTKIIKATYNNTYNAFEYEIVNAGECNETINYISKPEIYKNMIPVIYENNKWVKADINTKWYDYINKKWANAVYVKEQKTKENPNSKSRYEYMNAEINTEIEQTDILAHFVWIPRFRYELFNNQEQEINIVFESTSTMKSDGTKNWLTHKAFTKNNQELSGIWISKYEISQNEENAIIKKEQIPWTNISFDDAVNIANNISNQNNIYGITKKTKLITNTEWAALSYLAQSKYGINEKIEPTNSTLTGQTNSTTGNETGIYDMSGLSKEYVNLETTSENELGEALIETRNWYNDTNTFINEERKYLIRGNSSIFNYENSYLNSPDTSFRISLSNNDI